MKKVLLCAGVLALAVSCSENDYDSTSLQNNSKGINFVSIVDEPATRGEMEVIGTTHYPFWYAEQDKIGITSIYTAMGGTYTPGDVKTTWGTANEATYKATKSKRDGEFTAIANTDILWFIDDEVGAFITVSPATFGTYSAPSGADILTYDSPISDAQTQTGNNGQGVFDNMFQIGFATGSKVNAYDAVGETVNLAMKRQNVTVIFNVSGVDEYTEDFGNLEAIELSTTTEGAALVTNGSTFVVTPATDIKKFDESTVVFTPSTTPTDVKKAITLTLDNGDGTGLKWSDDSYAYMATDPVNRGGKTETLTAAYTFANIDLAMKITTGSNWNTGDVKGLVTLDIDSYDYLVTNETSGGSKDRTLILNRGTLSSILAADGKVKWPILTAEEIAGSVTQVTVDLEEFATLRITPELSTADLEKLKNFTGAKKIVLKGNATIPANTFAGLALEYIDFPIATTIDATAFESGLATLTTVLLPKYEFSTSPMKVVLAAQTALETIDISAVKTFGSVFPGSGISFNKTTLKNVTLGSDVVVGSGAFTGCSAMDNFVSANPVTVIGSAFEGCTALGVKTKNTITVKLVDNEVPDAAFKGCANLKSILNASTGTYLAPASVGASAFEDCVMLEEVSLKNATILGASAFSGCAELLSIDEYSGSENKVLWVTAKDIPANAFAGCNSIVYAYFENAETIASNMLNVGASNKLEEIKFMKAFTSDAITTTDVTFGATPGVITLYVNSAQKGVDSKKLTVGKGTTTDITFLNILK